MTSPKDEFYSRLSGQYSVRIRQLVPKYDDMVECIVDLIMLHGPRAILDVGVGTGELTRRILDALPKARVIAVESCRDMVAVARTALSPFGQRMAMVQADVRALQVTTRFDAIVSNLVLHNLSTPEKVKLLTQVRRWLDPSGVFLWGDFIRHRDPEIHAHFMERRVALARAAGCPAELATANFEKERTRDFPLTIHETLSAVGRAGFEHQEIVWMHDTFAVFYLRPRRGRVSSP